LGRPCDPEELCSTITGSGSDRGVARPEDEALFERFRRDGDPAALAEVFDR
jgi:hypothetical protein